MQGGPFKNHRLNSIGGASLENSNGEDLNNQFVLAVKGVKKWGGGWSL